MAKSEATEILHDIPRMNNNNNSNKKVDVTISN